MFIYKEPAFFILITVARSDSSPRANDLQLSASVQKRKNPSKFQGK